MKKEISLAGLILCLSGCIAVPVNDESHDHICKISSDHKTLKIVNVAEQTNSYYNISGTLLSPILIPTSALISGTYVIINNIYHFGEEKIVCDGSNDKQENYVGL